MKPICYFYILKCSDKTKYYGQTNNLIERLIEHSKGHVWSTKNKRPIELIYYEELNTRSEALRRERFNGILRKECLGYLKYKKQDLTKIQQKVNEFLNYYHNKRPHLSLGMKTPAEFTQCRI